MTAAILGSSHAAVAQRAPIFLEPGHWSYDAIRRLSVAGMAPPSGDPALAPVTLQHARAVFAHAAATAEARGLGSLARLANGYDEWLRDSDTTGVLALAAVRAGWAGASGEALGGDGFFVEEDWEGAQPLGRTTGPAAALRAHGWLHRRASWSFDGGYLEDWTVTAATAALALGPFDLWAGRRGLHYGAGRGGGIVLGSGFHAAPELAHRTSAAIDGVGLHVREPFHFPSFLRLLGPDRIEIVAGRLPRSGIIERPFIVFGRLIGTPFSRRFTLGVNRGAIFGGEGNEINASRLLGLLIGLHGGEEGEFENQIFSVVLRYRPPLGPVPLELYYERGMDDTAGAFFDVPATVAGIDLAALPGLGPVSLGVEHTRYTGARAGNPPWYRSVFFRGSWADEGRLFAHPLGGHGREWLVHARVDVPERGVLLRADGFTRHRGAENLFAPEREGRSNGGALTIDFTPRRRATLRLHASYEDAARWDLHRLSATISYAFGGAVR